MGLDQYLYRSKLLRENDDEYNKLVRETAKEVAYWRKANQIRQWFVDKCDYPPDGNCIEFDVSQDQLEDLISDCEDVLKDHSLADELLPTSEGLFFGGTNYNESYFDVLESTIKKLKDVIEETDWSKERVCYFEWW